MTPQRDDEQAIARLRAAAARAAKQRQSAPPEEPPPEDAPPPPRRPLFDVPPSLLKAREIPEPVISVREEIVSAIREALEPHPDTTGAPPRRNRKAAKGVPINKAAALQRMLDEAVENGDKPSQEKMAISAGFFRRDGTPDRNPVRKAMALHREGYSLVTSHPDFLPAIPDPDMAYWPTPKKRR